MRKITDPDLSFEIPLWQAGLSYVAGLDEAGRGPWAGPVSAAAVILPADPQIQSHLTGVRDSKMMSTQQRAQGAATVRSVCTACGVGFASNEEIDILGILPATRLAMQRALTQLAQAPQHLLLDALLLPDVDLPQTRIIHGDARSLSIAAASVLAKTSRDAVMQELELQYPGYGFARHKGYGTPQHQQALQRLGPCPAHRRSFRPLRTYGETGFTQTIKG